MSRIGKKPVVLAKGVVAKRDGEFIVIRGPKGELRFDVGQKRYAHIDVVVSDKDVTVNRADESKDASREQGTARALIQNMVVGTTEGYKRILDIVGVGYKAELKGKELVLNLGFSHPIEFTIPSGIDITVDKQTRLTVTGIDKQMVGQVSAQLRMYRPPEPYKGKGVRYADEVVRRKVGKTAASAGGGK